MYTLRKNFYSSLTHEIFWILLAFAQGAMFPVASKNFFIEIFFPTFIIFYVFSTFKSPTAIHGNENKLLLSLPVTKKDILNDRYICFLIYSIIYIAILIFSNIFFCICFGKPFKFLWGVYFINFFICICISAEILTLDLFSSKAKSIIFFAQYIILFGLPKLLKDYSIFVYLNDFAILAVQKFGIIFIITLIICLILSISYIFSLSVFKKHEY